jgi:hypothetical protein
MVLSQFASDSLIAAEYNPFWHCSPSVVPNWNARQVNRQRKLSLL